MADQQSTPEPPDPGPSSKPEPHRDPEPMTRERAIELLKTDVPAWNKWREENPNHKLPDLGGAHLEGADLRGAYLKAADLTETHLEDANLIGAHLELAELYNAHLEGANLRDASLERAKLHWAHLYDANLAGADLSHADLICTDLTCATLDSSDFYGAHTHGTVFADVDLTSVRHRESIVHDGPSHISTDTLVNSRGQIPGVFLRGCGLQRWEVEAAKLYDPGLTPELVNDIQYKIFALRTGPMFLGGIFISYSHEDAKFVDKLYARLMNEGANVWRDTHDMVAGDLEKQVDRAIRFNDVVVLVLSASSVNSDWVEHELEKALKKEKDEKRDVLCPVALDDAWKAKMDDVLWRQVKKKNVLDFSKWETNAFEAPFGKLIKGLRTNFPRPNADPPAGAPKADG